MPNAPRPSLTGSHQAWGGLLFPNMDQMPGHPVAPRKSLSTSPQKPPLQTGLVFQQGCSLVTGHPPPCEGSGLRGALSWEASPGAPERHQQAQNSRGWSFHLTFFSGNEVSI